MTTLSATDAVLLKPSAEGWRRYDIAQGTVWFFGHLYDHADAFDALKHWPAVTDRATLSAFIDRLDGHFALIAELPGCVVAAVDPVRSIPLYFVQRNGAVYVSAEAETLRAACGLEAVDAEAALALAMAGYTVGSRTLHHDLQQLAPGEYLVAAMGGACSRERYHRYTPWQIEERGAGFEEARLADMTLALTERMVRQAGNRIIAVPLSAGRDSRLIISALAELGARNVVCFAYGLPGNYEAEASRRIAGHLGYEWHFTPFTPASQRRFWGSAANADYQAFADSDCSTTVVHDLPAIQDLLAHGIVDKTAILVNGNSGDYISGLHIQPPVSQGLGSMTPKARRDAIVRTIVKKHFRLWQALATPENDDIIGRQLHAELDSIAPGEIGAREAHGYYEYLEFQDRQAKYVIARQRLYEYLGLEWRLPLWSRSYLDFWQTVPLELKRGQKLYADMLRKRNWGGVWGDEWQFPRRVSPRWMRWGVRPLAMAACAPFGRSTWHAVDRRFLSYWTDLFAWQAIEPFSRVALDRRGARHLVAWHTEAYLRRKGIAWNGKPF